MLHILTVNLDCTTGISDPRAYRVIMMQNFHLRFQTHRLKNLFNQPQSDILVPLLFVIGTLLTYLPTLTYTVTGIYPQADGTQHLFYFQNWQWVLKKLCLLLESLPLTQGGQIVVARSLSITLHLINGIMVYALASRIQERLTPVSSLIARVGNAWTALVTLLFLLHPAQTHTVTGFSVGMEQIVITTCVLTIHLALLAGRFNCSLTANIVYGLTCLIATILGCGTSMLIVVAPATALMVCWLLTRTEEQGCDLEVLISVLLYIIIGIALFLTPTHQALVHAATHLHVDMFRMVHIVASYLAPFGLAAYYSSFCPTVPNAWTRPTLYALVTGLSFAAYYEFELIALGSLWFLLTSLPLVFDIQHIVAIGDHIGYLPGIGVLMLASATALWLLDCTWQRLNKTQQTAISFALFSLLAVILIAGCYARNLSWSSPTAFGIDVMSGSPYDPATAVACAATYKKEGNFERASEVLVQARERMPQSGILIAEQGKLNIEQGAVDDGLALVRKAVTFEPDNVQIWFMLSEALNAHGDKDLAQQAFKQAEHLLQDKTSRIE